jgi:hypothetical protein
VPSKASTALASSVVALQVRVDAIDEDEMRELVLDAWRMVVPKRVAAQHATRR